MLDFLSLEGTMGRLFLQGTPPTTSSSWWPWFSENDSWSGSSDRFWIANKCRKERIAAVLAQSMLMLMSQNGKIADW